LTKDEAETKDEKYSPMWSSVGRKQKVSKQTQDAEISVTDATKQVSYFAAVNSMQPVASQDSREANLCRNGKEPAQSQRGSKKNSLSKRIKNLSMGSGYKQLERALSSR